MYTAAMHQKKGTIDEENSESCCSDRGADRGVATDDDGMSGRSGGHHQRRRRSGGRGTWLAEASHTARSRTTPARACRTSRALRTAAIRRLICADTQQTPVFAGATSHPARGPAPRPWRARTPWHACTCPASLPCLGAASAVKKPPSPDRSAQALIDQARQHAARPLGEFFCRCGCGRLVTNWTQECHPQPWWDTPGLPPRRTNERCANHHGICAYRDDDPYRCPRCHTIPERCTCRNGSKGDHQP